MEERARMVLQAMQHRRLRERVIGLAGMTAFMGLYVMSWSLVL